MSHSDFTATPDDYTEQEYSLLDELIAVFEYRDGPYAREEVDYVLAHRAMFIPELLDILRDVLEDPEGFATDEHYAGHLYAIMLLGHFREEAAHDIILALSRLPSEVLGDLFGDIITEDLAAILLRTCGGSIEGIKALAMDGDAYEFCRGAATDAIALAVCQGMLSRDEALSFLHTFLEDDVAAENGFVTSLVAGSICDIGPSDSLEKIRNAFEKGSIDPSFIEFGWYETCAAMGNDACMKQTLEQLGPRSLDDVHAAMSWWACFKELPDDFIPPPVANSGRRRDASKKAKRKMSAASRKKNRR